MSWLVDSVKHFIPMLFEVLAVPEVQSDLICKSLNLLFRQSLNNNPILSPLVSSVMPSNLISRA